MSTQAIFPEPHELLELRGLIAGLCDAELTMSQVARLEEMVCTNSACASYYVSAMSVYATLPQHVGIGRGISGIKLITEWQSRDNEFWNDVVKVATALEDPADPSRSQSERRLYLDPRRTTEPPHSRTRRIVQKFSNLVGVKSQTIWLGILCATSIAFAVVIGWLLSGGRDQEHRQIAGDAKDLPVYVARLSKVRQVEWGRGIVVLPVQSPLSAGQRLILTSGVAEITFDSGVATVIEGPAEFEIRSNREGFLHRGRTVTQVPPQAIGFAIQTERIRIVDLGTRFGVDVDGQQNASVHVLTGAVEAHLPANAVAAQTVRVEANRAVRYDAAAKSLGQVPLERSRFEEIQNQLDRPVITGVRATSGKPYRIVPGGLQEDVLAYIDRDYQWNGLGSAGFPQELIGADYVLTSNNDDLDPAYEMHVTVAEPATLYVFFDNRARTPEWLSRDFVDTGHDIGLDTGGKPEEFARGPGRSIDVQFSVWKRSIPPGTTVCGPTNQPNVAHYGIAIVAGQR